MLTDQDLVIKAALTKSLQLLNADPVLVEWVKSWSNGASDDDVLHGIREWNDLEEQTSGIEEPPGDDVTV